MLSSAFLLSPILIVGDSDPDPIREGVTSITLPQISLTQSRESCTAEMLPWELFGLCVSSFRITPLPHLGWSMGTVMCDMQLKAASLQGDQQYGEMEPGLRS